MLALQIIYILSSIVALAAGLPQMRKLMHTKNSDEFSLNTWIMWGITQIISVTYVSTLGDPLVIAICSTWVVFYLVMVMLIIKYRPQQELEAVPIE